MNKLICERCLDEYDEGEIYPSKFFNKIFCIPCENKYKRELEQFRIKFINNQPERSKREDLDLNNGFFPPPWNFYEHPEKTEGWIEFQRQMRKDPEYYLRCGALNTDNT